MKKLLVVLGPTAVGKTAFSLRLANDLGGEIVSADSRLFYRGMDIGTAKPTWRERSLIPHHLIDICQPNERVTLGQYQRMAYAVIEDIIERGRLPMLVGGTGQYIMAVVEGWGIPEVPPHKAMREQLELLGEDELYRWLCVLDAQAAAKIDQRNIRRVVRALEVTLVTGQPISDLQRKTAPDYDICMIGLNRSRRALYLSIDQRVDNMMDVGLLEEVIRLKDAGYDRTLSSMSGLGYRQLLAYLSEECALDEAVERIKFETHRFARQQNTWFRQDDPRIHWFNLEKKRADEAAINFVREWLASEQTNGE